MTKGRAKKDNKQRKGDRAAGGRLRWQWTPRTLIRERRIARQIPATQLASDLGVSLARLYEYESCRRFPSWGMLAEIARLLKIKTLGDLVDPASRFDHDYRVLFGYGHEDRIKCSGSSTPPTGE